MIFLLLVILCLAVPLGAQPRVVVARTQYLVFEVAPLSSQGTAVDQARRRLKSLNRTLVNVRAFVVGTEDAEAVYKTLEQSLAKRGKWAPAVTVVVVGGLAVPGARVVLESVRSTHRPVNPHGLAFVSGQPASADKPVAEMAPLIEKSLADLRLAHRAAGVEPAAVLRLTCFMTSLADLAAVRQKVENEFPKAASNFVQLLGTPSRALVECETVARLRSTPIGPLQMVQPEGLGKSPNYSHVALLGPGKIAMTEIHPAAGLQDSDARAVFSEVEKALSAVGSSLRSVAMSSLYPASDGASNLIRKIRFEFYDKNRPPASTLLVFEGLPKNAPFGVAVVAAVTGASAESKIGVGEKK